MTKNFNIIEIDKMRKQLSSSIIKDLSVDCYKGENGWILDLVEIGFISPVRASAYADLIVEAIKLCRRLNVNIL